MTFVGIGLIVGIIIGLTGAGGAMISIPFFLNFLGSSLKEATVLSLVAVLIGTSVNLIGQISKIDMRVALSLSISGILANYGSLSLKALTPDFVVAGLLTAIAVLSLWTVWSNKISSTEGRITESVILKSFVAGFLLGVLTTLTGLGGGVILVPILIILFGKKYNEALPTSLATIFFISLTSFIFQSEIAMQLLSYSQFGFLLIGSFIAYFLLKSIMQKIDDSKINIVRKVVFSLVTVYSATSVIIKVL